MANHRVDFYMSEEDEKTFKDMVKYYGDMTPQEYFRRAINIGLDDLISMYLERLDDDN